MNERQRKVLLCGVVAAVVAGLFPPWTYRGILVGYRFIFGSHNFRGYLDMRRLFLEWVLIALVAAIPLLITQRPKGNAPRVSERGERKPPSPAPREPIQKEALVDGRRSVWVVRNWKGLAILGVILALLLFALFS